MGKKLIVRKRLHAQQSGKCYWCSYAIQPETATADHLIPRALGGRKGTNLVLSCKFCNFDKACLTPNEYIKRKLKAFEGFVKSGGF